MVADMEKKEMKIIAPEGYEIDKENSTFECIKFKPKKKALTYDDVARELFCDKIIPYINTFGEILENKIQEFNILDSNNCTTRNQAEKLLAINRLMNVAKYLNDGWIPDWNSDELKWFIEYNSKIKMFTFGATNYHKTSLAYFRTSKLVEQAFDILGKETVELALSTDW